MNIVNDLSEAKLVWDWGSYRLNVQDKLSRGCEMIDLRNWAKWNTDQQYHPGRNGIMIEKKIFTDHVLPKLNELYGKKDK